LETQKLSTTATREYLVPCRTSIFEYSLRSKERNKKEERMRIRSASRIEEVEEYENDEEQHQQKMYKEMGKYVNSLTQQELRERLILYMVDEKQRRYW
jgi:hypothetical protein